MARSDIKNRKEWLKLAGRSCFVVSRMARNLGISTRHLERVTHESFHRTPKDLLDDYQMKRAAVLLLEQRNVKSVAHGLGFRQLSHFSRKFKRIHGISPALFLAHKRPSSGNRRLF